MRMTLSAIRRFLFDLERESLFPDDGLQEDRDRAGEGEPEVFEHAFHQTAKLTPDFSRKNTFILTVVYIWTGRHIII